MYGSEKRALNVTFSHSLILMREVRDNLDSELVQPDAGALVESLRAFGYSPQSAIADLIDNSIAAGSRHVWVELFWNGTDSYVLVKDDCGR